MRDRYYRRVLDAAPVPLVVVSSTGQIVHLNPRASSAFGLRRGRQLVDVFVRTDREAATAWAGSWRTAEAERASHFEGSLITADGSVRYVHATASSQLSDRRVRGVVITLVDVTEQQARAERLERQAGTDALTGLASRPVLLDRLGEMTGGWVVLIDLDDFKKVNDAHGHVAGDEVLRTVAQRLLEAFPEPATVARFGGDEFVLLLVGGDALAAQEAVGRALEDLRSPMPLPSGPLCLTATAGLAAVDAHAERVLSRADAAMYDAKGAGRNQVRVYSEQDRHLSRQQLFAHVHSLEEQTRTDALTGLPNVRALREGLHQLRDAAFRDGTAFTAAFVDIDHFGSFNKQHGDAAGDRALTEVGQALVQASRRSDLVFRKGGEELVVLLPETSADTAAAAGERLRTAVEALGITHGGAPGTPLVTVTVGLATWISGEAPDAVVERAARAAFAAKTAGDRNTVRHG